MANIQKNQFNQNIMYILVVLAVAAGLLGYVVGRQMERSRLTSELLLGATEETMLEDLETLPEDGEMTPESAADTVSPAPAAQ